MYRYVGTAGGGGRLLRDAGEIADALSALRETLAGLLERKQEIEEKKAALKAAYTEEDPEEIPELEELTYLLDTVRDEILDVSEKCDVLRDELCETLYLTRRTRVS